MGEILFYKYELLGPLGSGGAGKVYLAKDLHLNRLVAAKESGEEFPAVEVKLLQELEHPGLPGIYDCFQWEKKTWVVMEYVDGMNLRQYLDRYGRVEEGQAVKWAVELCGILGYLHERHPAIIYRDLKPENIMIRRDGKLKLIDLGGALQFACGSKRQELCVGTPGYAPPEQWREPQGDVSWDVYGLGAVLHEMLTGENPLRPPYQRLPLSVYGKGHPKALEKIVRTCTEEKAGDRYRCVEQVANALLAYRKENLWERIREPVKGVVVSGIGACGGVCLAAPLLKGVPANQIPFPYLIKPLIFLTLSWILYLILFKIKKKKSFLRRQEKNIWLTEKKFSGLFSLLPYIFGGMLTISLFAAPMPPVYAGDTASAEEKLWVEMRDGQGRKMLLKDGAVYRTSDCVRFELPAGRLPDEELSVRLVAEGEDGRRYFSRVFLVRAE